MLFIFLCRCIVKIITRKKEREKKSNVIRKTQKNSIIFPNFQLLSFLFNSFYLMKIFQENKALFELNGQKCIQKDEKNVKLNSINLSTHPWPFVFSEIPGI